jgi:CPA2 family monovalent cation:H+ antiporter-2
MLAETEYRHEIEVDIEPFKGLLLGLFFISVGMSIDITQVEANSVWLIASVFGLFLVKGPIIYVLARLFGELRSVALETSLLLGQGGEFAFVIVGTASGLGLIPNETAQFMLIVTSMTMIATPLVAHAARRMALAVEAEEAKHGRSDADLPGNVTGHVIVVGYGRVGQMLGSLLESQDLPHVALDIDANLVASFHKKGGSVFHGDASRPEILRTLGVERAAALVVTMDNPHAAELAVAGARRHWPNLAIYARARDVEHAKRLIAQGASHVVPEATEASLQLGEMVLMGAGVPNHAASHLIEARRQAEQAAVDESRGR